MKIIIAGSGIGGLTAAIGLAKSGHNVRVLEQASELKPVGAGISLQPNALQALAVLGLDEAVIEQGRQSSVGHLRFANGKSVRDCDFMALLNEVSYLPVTIYRADLLDILFQAAIREGVEILFGHRLESFSTESDCVTVQAGSGRQVQCAALIGADGINSQVRAQLWGDRPPRYSGYVCWRGIVNDSKVVQSIASMNELWGSGARFGFMRCSPDKVYWFATRSTGEVENPDPDWRQTFEDWPNPVPAILEGTPDDQVFYNEISDREPIYPWGKGPVTLVGDAAHAMTPNFGQGGAQAIEDGVMLSLAADNRQASLERAFRRFESHRHPRTRLFVNESRQFGRIAQGGTTFWRFVRNRLLPLTPGSIYLKKLRKQYNFESHMNAFETR